VADEGIRCRPKPVAEKKDDRIMIQTYSSLFGVWRHSMKKRATCSTRAELVNDCKV